MLLRDDGQLHMYTFFTSSKLANYYWTNPTVDGSSVSTTQGNTASNTTSTDTTMAKTSVCTLFLRVTAETTHLSRLIITTTQV